MSEIVSASIKKAVKGTALIITGTVTSMVLLITIKILIARNTTKEELGTYTLSIAIVSVLSILATLGVHEGVARYVAILTGKDDIVRADSISRSALQINLISGMIAGQVLYLCAEFLSYSVFKNMELVYPLKIISFSIPFFVIVQVLNSILRGHGIITAKIYFLDVGIPLFFLIFLSSALLFGTSFLSIICTYVLSVVLGCVFMGIYGYRKIRLNPFLSYNFGQQSELLQFSFPLLIGIAMTMVMKWTGILMLGKYACPETVGVYDVSSSLSMLLLFFLAALEFVFMPIAGALYGRKQSFELARTYQILTKWLFSVTVPVFFILFLFPDQIITVLFSNRFTDAVPALRILSCGFLFHTLWGPNGIIMVVIGMSREISFVSFFGAIINIILNYILIKWCHGGIIGASTACISTYIVLNILVSIIIYKKTSIHPFTKSYVKAIAGSLLTGFMVFLVSSLLPQNAWLLPFYFMLFVAVYTFFLLITKSIDAEDISLIRDIIGRKLKKVL